MITVSSLNTDRIITAAKEAGAELISSKTDLEACLKICVDWYNDALVYTSRRSQKIEQLTARRLQLAANDLLAQLENIQRTPYLSFFFTLKKQRNPARPKRQRNPAPLENTLNLAPLKKQLLDLSVAIDTALRLESDSEPSTGLQSDFVDYLGYQDHFRSKSPLEWLVGVYLIETYGLNFSVEAGVETKNYIPFAMAVLKELGIKNGKFSYSAETIRRAVRRAVSGERDRRKAKKVDELQFTVSRQTQLYAACGRHWKHEAIHRTLRLLEGLEAQTVSP
jgi:hypothetical protein